MASVNEELDSQDMEVAHILLQFHGQVERSLPMMVNQNPAPMRPLTNRNNNMNILRVTAGPSCSSNLKGSKNHLQFGSKNAACNILPPKKCPDTIKRHQLEQMRCERARSFFRRALKYELQRVRMKDAFTQTDDEYFPPTKDENVKALYEELKVLRKQTKTTDIAIDKTPSINAGAGEEAENILESERACTCFNETPKARCQRKTNTQNMFCNESKQVQITNTDSDDDSDYQADTEEDQEVELQKIKKQDTEYLQIPTAYAFQNNEKETMVAIGLGNARVPARVFNKVNWKGSHTTATRKLLSAVFPRSVLATHSLTGKKSPAFPNKAAKRKLDPLLVEDIVKAVVDKCNVKEAQVRNIITTKCADESKMLRNRLHFKENNRQKYPAA